MAPLSAPPFLHHHQVPWSEGLSLGGVPRDDLRVFDAEGRGPQYHPPRVGMVDSGAMRFCGRWEVDRPVYMHLIEYMENTVDVQHFTPMHGSMSVRVFIRLSPPR